MTAPTIRPATIEGVPTVLGFITLLAEFERAQHEVLATAEELERTLFGETPAAHAPIATIGARPVGRTIRFFSYSARFARRGVGYRKDERPTLVFEEGEGTADPA